MHTWRSPTAGGTFEARGEGEEAKQRSVYTSLISCTRRKPSGGVSSPKPQTRQVTGQVSLVGLARTMDTSIRSREISTQNLDTWLKVQRKQAEVGGQTEEYPVLGSLCGPIINNTITKTCFLSHSFITGHTEPRQGTPGRRVFVLFWCIYNFEISPMNL